MPELALDMIEVGESSGALAPMLNSVAEFYEEEVGLRLTAMVSLIEPVILVFMGVLVAFILISLYLPIFSFSIADRAGKIRNRVIMATPDSNLHDRTCRAAADAAEEREQARRLAERYRCGFVDLTEQRIDPELFRTIQPI